jgi:hypothetical protein
VSYSARELQKLRNSGSCLISTLQHCYFIKMELLSNDRVHPPFLYLPTYFRYIAPTSLLYRLPPTTHMLEKLPTVTALSLTLPNSMNLTAIFRWHVQCSVIMKLPVDFFTRCQCAKLCSRFMRKHSVTRASFIVE